VTDQDVGRMNHRTTGEAPRSGAGHGAAPSRRFAWLGSKAGFGVGFFAVAFFALACMALIAWNHQRWTEVLRADHAHNDQFEAVEHGLLRAELLAERLRNGDVSVQPAAVLAALASAMRGATQLHGSSADNQVGDWPEDLRNERHRSALLVMEALQDLRDQLEVRLDALPSTPTLALRRAHERLAAAQAQLAQAVLREREQRVAAQAQSATLLLLLVGALAAALLGMMHRSRIEQARSVAEIGAQEARLRATLSALPEVSFLLDAEGRYLDAWGPDEKFATAREGLLGHSVDEHLEPAQAARVRATIDQALRSGQPARMDIELNTLSGRRSFEGRAAAVAGQDLVVWISWDVTERLATEQRVKVLSRLYSFLSQVNQAVVQTRSEAELYERIGRSAISHGDFRAAWVMRADTGEGHGRTTHPAGDPDLLGHIEQAQLEPQGAQPAKQVLQSGQTCWSRGGLRTPEGRQLDLVALPLCCNGRCDAALVLAHEHLDPDDPDERQLFAEIAGDLAFAREQFARDEALQKSLARTRLHAAALESTQDAVMVTDERSVIVSVNRAFTEITGYAEAEVTGRIPRFLESDRHDPAFYEQMWRDLVTQGRWRGEMWNRRKNGEVFAQWMSVSAVCDGQGQPHHYVAVFTDTTAHKLAEERLHHMAHYDPLTKLPNRPMVLSRLEHGLAAAERLGLQVAVLFIDLDNFKTVNDSLGHEAGDQLLLAVAERLSHRTRREDTLGRLGGDEFVLVMEHLHDARDASLVAQELLQLLAEPFRIGETALYVQASIGISLYPNDGATVGELVRDADAAMYQAKRAGRNTYRFYTEALTAAAQSRLALDTRLRRALERQEFQLWYQPLYRLPDRQLIGLEALVRLHQPDLPPIAPSTFIPLLEETGQIIALGEWVTHEACRQGRAWLDAGLDFGRLAINLSPVEVRRGGADERLRAALAASGMPAHRLELEITESGLMEQGEHAEAFLRSLDAQGVQLAIDDFGTGYSSLAYLKRFPVGKLKIDRSFVNDLTSDPNDAQLVQTMVTLGRSLGLSVLAEGVESPEQLAYLSRLGCEAAQGFLFGAPRPAAEVPIWLPRSAGPILV
jgi:diguanylate cyclase (GGDEF)-like protein/PAS domain S-box-containing protein